MLGKLELQAGLHSLLQLQRSARSVYIQLGPTGSGVPGADTIYRTPDMSAFASFFAGQSDSQFSNGLPGRPATSGYAPRRKVCSGMAEQGETSGQSRNGSPR